MSFACAKAPPQDDDMTKNLSLALNLLAIVVGMLLLTYASVPLYRLFCAMTGYGGTPQEATHAPGPVLSRQITVTFDAETDPALPWEFTPGQKSLKVKIGEQTLTYYVAQNISNQPVTGRAVYNVVPHAAGAYFTKIDCFCFKEQTLAPHAKVNMPVSFFIDPAIADDPDLKNLKIITLSYTFFEVKK
jgi:cytochrome c oxidase assembly protein subunit 11